MKGAMRGAMRGALAQIKAFLKYFIAMKIIKQEAGQNLPLAKCIITIRVPVIPE